MSQTTAEDIVRRATAAFNAGRPDAARALCEQGLTRRPDDPMLHHLLAAVLFSQGEIETARKHVPRYPLVSATLIGRLAVAKDRQGQHLGAVLLADALQRAFERAGTVGFSMVIVNALDEPAAGFYSAHGFVRLPDSLRLVLPMRLAGGTPER